MSPSFFAGSFNIHPRKLAAKTLEIDGLEDDAFRLKLTFRNPFQAQVDVVQVTTCTPLYTMSGHGPKDRNKHLQLPKHLGA